MCPFEKQHSENALLLRKGRGEMGGNTPYSATGFKTAQYVLTVPGSPRIPGRPSRPSVPYEYWLTENISHNFNFIAELD